MHTPAAHTTLGQWSTDGFRAECAIRCPLDETLLTYARLREEVRRVSLELWRHGVDKGDRVSLVLDNGPEFVIAFLAVTSMGAVAAPLNPSYTVDEFRYYLKDMGTRLVITGNSGPAVARASAELEIPRCEARWSQLGGLMLEHALPLVRACGDPPAPTAGDIALFLHTSGTTGRPKGVPLTHANLLASTTNIVSTYGLGTEDVTLLAMPLFHVHGLIGVCLSTLRSGGTLLVPPRFSASRFWDHVAGYGVTWYSAVPTIHQILLQRAEQELSPRGVLRFIRSCSAPLAPATMRQLEERFDVPVLQAYGMTEASHQIATNRPPPEDRIAGSVGRGAGIDIAILDEAGRPLPAETRGEVAIRGASVTGGYHENPAANEAAFVNGWFRTGDQGSIDPRGYLTLAGRIKELINRGGEKISPAEVDAVLLEHPSVAEAAAFAVPDRKYGEEVHAAVVLRNPETPERIQSFCRERLAEFKVPKTIHITVALPRGDTGKIQRSLFAQRFLR